MNLNSDELATVLAALRCYQNDMRFVGNKHNQKSQRAWAREHYPEHFGGVAPLDCDQIDALCERLNCEVQA